MAVTNFRASDFPKGMKSKKAPKSAPREDNEILDKELDNAVRDPKEGEKAAKDLDKKVEEAGKTLNEEISHTETPLDDQPKAPKASRTRKSAK